MHANSDPGSSRSRPLGLVVAAAIALGIGTWILSTTPESAAARPVAWSADALACVVMFLLVNRAPRADAPAPAPPDELLAEFEALTREVAHDVRSSLGAIDNFSAVLSDSRQPGLDAESRAILQRMSGSARSAVPLLEDLRTYSTVARQQLTPGRVDMRGALQTAWSDLQSRSRVPLPTLTVGELDSVHADPALMTIAWSQLLTHAAKAARSATQPSIAVTSMRRAGEVRYRVRATVAGQPAAVTQPANGAVTEAGAPIVARIVRRHGGRTWTERDAGTGLSTCFSLPDAGD